MGGVISNGRGDFDNPGAQEWKDTVLFGAIFNFTEMHAALTSGPPRDEFSKPADPLILLLINST